MKIWRAGSNRWTAKLAACLFMLQAVLLGFSLGAAASPMPLDQFGNVICVSAADGSGHPAPKKSDHHGMVVDCCSLGCAMFAADLSPAAPSLSARIALPQAVAAIFAVDAGIGAGPVETPRQTRAPPLPL